MTINFKNRLLIAITLPTVGIILPAIALFLGNFEELFGDPSVLYVPLVIYIFASLTFLLILSLCNKNSACQIIFISLIIGFSIVVWIQSQIFLWPIHPQNGEAINWNLFDTENLVEIFTWILIPLFTLTAGLKIRSKKYINLFFKYFLLLIITSLFLNILFLSKINEVNLYKQIFEDVNNFIDNSKKTEKTVKQSFAFHNENNYIIIVLDTFQSDVFHEILKKHKEELNFFNGFIFFPNSVSGYPTTKFSILNILSGKFYENESSLTKDYLNKFLNNSLPKYFQKKDYGITGDFHDGTRHVFGEENVFPKIIREKRFWGYSQTQWHILELTLFRSLPMLGKQYLYRNGQWLSATIFESSNVRSGIRVGDDLFIKSFLLNANLESNKKGEFKFIHLMGAHYPIDTNENFEYIGVQESNRHNYLNQARGVIFFVGMIINKIKSMGIYKNSQILIIGDHGTQSLIPSDLVNPSKEIVGIPQTHLASARPVFLYKPRGADVGMHVSNNPVQLGDAYCIFTQKYSKDCPDPLLSPESERVRLHYRYEWEHLFWKKNYAPNMTLYEISGDARDTSSWKNTRSIFSQEKILRENFYSINRVIRFKSGGDFSPYLGNGWSSPEPTHIWTIGKKAEINLFLDVLTTEKHVLKINGFGLLPSGMDHQIISIRINERFIGDLRVRDDSEYLLIVPKNTIKLGKNNIEIFIKNPVAPCENQMNSDDCRLLGFAMREFSIEVYKDGQTVK